MGYRLSPSTINLYFDCPRCFQLKLEEGIERPRGPFPSLPSGMDRAIKEHFDRFREKGEKPPELEEAGIDAEPLRDEELLEKARDWRKEPRWKDPETGAVLRGGVDDLLEQDGKLVVVDYKTRGYPPQEDVPGYYRRQVNLYNLMLEENGYETGNYAIVLYYHPDRVKSSGDFLFNWELRKVDVNPVKAKSWVRRAVKCLGEEKQEHSESCDYSRLETPGKEI